MKKTTRTIVIVALLCVLLTGVVYSKGKLVKVKKDQADNPSWLNVLVTHNQDNLFHVAINAKNRTMIAGYDLTLRVIEGEMKGLYIPVEIIKVKPGFTAGMILPKSIISKATLTLSEHLGAEDGSWSATGGSIYEIDLGSYLPDTENTETETITGKFSFDDLRNSAIVQFRGLWDSEFERYIKIHQVYVCTILSITESQGKPIQYQLKINEVLRGRRTKELKCELPGDIPVQIQPGKKVILLGNDSKLGFNVIGWWIYSDMVEAEIREAI